MFIACGDLKGVRNENSNGCISVDCGAISELAIGVFSPTTYACVREDGAGVIQTCGDGGCIDEIADGDGGAAVVACAVAELPEDTSSPTFDGFVAQQGTIVIVAGGDLQDGVAASTSYALCCCATG